MLSGSLLDAWREPREEEAGTDPPDRDDRMTETT
jgi:hypothetical protein